jgi:hypothetical protein
MAGSGVGFGTGWEGLEIVDVPPPPTITGKYGGISPVPPPIAGGKKPALPAKGMDPAGGGSRGRIMGGSSMSPVMSGVLKFLGVGSPAGSTGVRGTSDT